MREITRPEAVAHYFYFSGQGFKLIFRYYSLSALFKKPNSVEIPKAEFIKYQYEKKMLGLRSYLVLYQQTQNGIAKYPPISISLLKKRETADLLKFLKK